MHFNREISNDLSVSEKEENLRQFRAKSEQWLRGRDANSFTYLDRLGITRDRKYFQKAVYAVFPNASPVIFAAHYDSFNKRNGSQLSWILLSFGIGAGIWLIMLCSCSLNTIRLNAYLSRNKAI